MDDNQPKQEDISNENNEQPAAPPAVAPVMPPKKRSKKPLLITLLVLVVLVAAGLLFWLMRDNKEDNTPSTTPVTETNPAEQIINEIKAAVEAEYPDVSTRTDDESFVAVKLPDYDYYSLADDGAILTVFSSNEDDEAVEDDTRFEKLGEVLGFIGNYLEGKGYVAAETDTDRHDTVVVSEDGNIYCSYGDENSDPINVECGTKEAAAEYAERLKEFVEAFRRDADEDFQSEFNVLSIGEIKASETEGYYIMTGGIGTVTGEGGAATFFYQTPDKKWHFFRAAQDSASCDEYNTDDIRKAFAGHQCWVEGEEELQTVQP